MPLTLQLEKSARLVLYFDILGFREMVRRKKAERVYDVLNATLERFENMEQKRGEFKTLYFSDTILFYQQPLGFDFDRLRSLWSAANILYRGLLGDGIPVNGVITYGSFAVENAEVGQHQLYFGQALIEAYDMDKEAKWLGITLCPSVVKKLKQAEIEQQCEQRVWKRGSDGKGGDTLLLNPLLPLIRAWEKEEFRRSSTEYSASLERSLRAFAFLLKTADEFDAKGEFASSAASRYHVTLAFVRSMYLKQ